VVENTVLKDVHAAHEHIPIVVQELVIHQAPPWAG